MPYLHEITRQLTDKRGFATTPGELNYRISQEVIKYIKLKGLRYATINDVVGALTGALLEFYSRIARPYEESKIQENGDVYTELVEMVPKTPIPGPLTEEP